MKVFLTGGSGFLGQEVLKKLLLNGHVTKALVRSQAAREKVIAAGGQAVDGDLSKISAFEQELQGVDVVVHCAAPVQFWGPWEIFQRGIVDATRELLEASARQGVKRFIHISSESVLQDRAPLIGPLGGIDESFPYPEEPNSPYGKAKKQAEEYLLKTPLPIEILILRPPFIWGKGCPSFDPILSKAKSGQFVWVNGGTAEFEAVHVENVAEAVSLALTRGRDRGVYFITDQKPTTVKEFFIELFQAAGVRPPRQSIPLGLARGLAGVFEWIWKKAGLESSPPLSRFDLAFVSMPRRYYFERARRELRYFPVVSREQGFSRLRQ